MSQAEPNPYQSPEAPCPPPQPYVLVCPNCGGSFPLTWRRYFGAPSGRHRCPHCQAKLRLRRTVKYFAKAAITVILLMGPAMALLALAGSYRFGWAVAVLAVVLAYGAATVLDRKYDTERPIDRVG